ncbi:hypothetical protein [Saccharothrix sp. NRRL B-16348]|uniref:hypothetical protein n=1 Tax=Saccharothrix sp. NRRL B-16348 TaxID=1415542 RepID=UPI000A3DFC49|nr:hypothetical protein [Saccharothrix sp. NRRL B-16348]
MGGSDKHEMTRDEIRALSEDATPFWYGDDRQTIVALTVRPEGVEVSLTCFATDEQLSTVVEWKEFDNIAADVPSVVASGALSRKEGRPIHIRRPIGSD